MKFDRNPLRNFEVCSNFSTIQGADDAIKTTIRGL
eukprot:CAMPEP_0201526466 /NCGR_PEP_ID=MMETSP0161_2-20130828/31945_1 /ASSEMBLY_ACC=CAM_ASM_000251 /TAXON_ID=180227 /ORGANISM="Neoparamoeba aestuarina, Strain SoJaBio B1-5/56/2" /LENGTH=34 /DNA_ID= /DNA_START= /DNA_END= /DNA_ORIENTATION=